MEIWGGIGSTPAQERHAGFSDVINKESGITLLSEQPVDGDWKQDLAYEMMAEALDTYPRIDLVYAHNDPMAYGAYLAAQDAGRAQEMAFLGIDGIPAEGVKWVAEGILKATFLYRTPGAEGIRQALKLLRGEPISKRIILPTMTIDATNAADILRNNHLLE
jgi:ribose transport system substrate-binding protein